MHDTKPRVYLAGPIAGLTAKEASGWRNDFAEQLEIYNIIGLSPMRGKAHVLADKGVLTNQGYDESPLSTQKGIVTRDRNDVMNSDLVLFNLRDVNHLSLGTAVEFGWADAFRKPIIAVLDVTDTHNPFTHAFVKELSGFIVPTLEEAIPVIKTVLGR